MHWIDRLHAADVSVLLAVASSDAPWLALPENIVSSELLLAAAVIAPLLYALRLRGMPAAYWGGVYLLLKAAVWTLKYAVGRPRPMGVWDVESALAIYPRNPSFPSGVAADMAFIAFLLGMLYPRYRPAFIALFALLAFLRVTAAAHYPSDVIAGYLLGWLCAALGGRALKGLPQRREG